VRALANPELVIILIGNKNDKADEREVSYLEASRFAQEHGKTNHTERNRN
jgi:Ras-related protein Rab-4B